jgi:hypothetical protein
MRAMEKDDGTASMRQDHSNNSEDHDARRDVNWGKTSTEHHAAHTHKQQGKENGTARGKPTEAPTTTKRPRGGTTIKLGPGSYTLQPRLQVILKAHACVHASFHMHLGVCCFSSRDFFTCHNHLCAQNS